MEDKREFLSVKANYKVFNTKIGKYCSGNKSKATWQRLGAALDFAKSLGSPRQEYGRYPRPDTLSDYEIHVFPLTDAVKFTVNEVQEEIDDRKLSAQERQRKYQRQKDIKQAEEQLKEYEAKMEKLYTRLENLKNEKS